MYVSKPKTQYLAVGGLYFLLLLIIDRPRTFKLKTVQNCSSVILYDSVAISVHNAHGSVLSDRV